MMARCRSSSADHAIRASTVPTRNSASHNRPVTAVGLADSAAAEVVNVRQLLECHGADAIGNPLTAVALKIWMARSSTSPMASGRVGG